MIKAKFEKLGVLATVDGGKWASDSAPAAKLLNALAKAGGGDSAIEDLKVKYAYYPSEDARLAAFACALYKGTILEVKLPKQAKQGVIY